MMQCHHRRRRCSTLVAATAAVAMAVVGSAHGFATPSFSSSLSAAASSWFVPRTQPLQQLWNNHHCLSLSMASQNDKDDNSNDKDTEPVAGSFFNPVPPEKESQQEVDLSQVKTTPPGVPMPQDDTDRYIAALLRQQNQQRSLASQPSTIGGIPTSQAPANASSGVGFGSPSSPPPKSKSSGAEIRRIVSPRPGEKPYIGIGMGGNNAAAAKKPLNDVRRPQYDDQGYTLYANEETGERKRVFEALVEYPCDFTLKVVGANEGRFVEEIVACVAQACGVEQDAVPFSQRRNGKWISITLQVPVASAEMLYSVYETIDRDPRVRFKF